MVPLRRARAAADASETARQQATQDRQRIIEFMQFMAEALGEGLARRELNQRIVHASILCTGASSACLFERTPRGTLRGTAVEGLFPPHRPINDEAMAKLTTRAKFIEQVLQAEEFPLGEGIVGRVMSSGRGELWRMRRPIGGSSGTPIRHWWCAR
jgi:sigma-B regulation protein RsbU (phosphoserine phosphatase)